VLLVAEEPEGDTAPLAVEPENRSVLEANGATMTSPW